MTYKKQQESNLSSAAFNWNRLYKTILDNKNDFNYKYFLYYGYNDWFMFEIGIWVGKETSIYDHFVEGMSLADDDKDIDQIEDQKTVIKIVFDLNSDEDVTIKLMNFDNLKHHFHYQQQIVVPFEQTIWNDFQKLVSCFEQNKIYILDLNDWYPVIKIYNADGFGNKD